MKTIKIFAVIITAFVLSFYFNSDSYSNNVTDCKCCTEQCTDAGCCKEGTAQGSAECCTDKCQNEACKECCAGGNCSMMKGSGESQNNEQLSDKEMKSCCSEKGSSEGNAKDCCK